MPIKTTPAFEKWFGASKVVDAAGAPLVVYHGTAADITFFDASKVGSKHVDVIGHFGDPDENANPDTFYFSDDVETANWYAKDSAKTNKPKVGANVMPVYLALKNPLVVDFMGEGIEYLAEDLERAKRDGNDGLIARNYNDGGVSTHYIAFAPGQIKSALGNNGCFDADHSDIRFSLVDQDEDDTEAPCP